MANKLEKLDTVITDLESQVASIKDFRDVLKEMERIAEDINTVGDSVSRHSTSFVDFSSELEAGIKSMDGMVKKFDIDAKQLERRLISRIQKMENAMNQGLEDMKSTNKKLCQQNVDIRNDITKNMNAVQSEIILELEHLHKKFNSVTNKVQSITDKVQNSAIVTTLLLIVLVVFNMFIK